MQSDRFLWILRSWACPAWRRRLRIPKSDMVVGWHRRVFARLDVEVVPQIIEPGSGSGSIGTSIAKANTITSHSFVAPEFGIYLNGMKQKGSNKKKPKQKPTKNKENAIEASSGVLEIHKHYVAGLKRAWRKAEGQKRMLLPETDLLRSLSVPTPPMLEDALGYHGRLRFVAFYYSPRMAEPVHCDGGDAFPIDRTAWNVFTSHPIVCPVLEKFHTLYGRLNAYDPLLSPSELSALSVSALRGYCGRFHMVVLDRETRQLFLGSWEATILFLNLAEPDEEMHVELEDGKLVSVGNERAPEMTPKSVVSALKAWLDDRLAD